MSLPEATFVLGTRRETVYTVNGERWRAVTGEFTHGGGGPGSYLFPWIGTVHHDCGKADVFPPEEVVRAVSRAEGVVLVGARFRRTGEDTSVVEYAGPTAPEAPVQAAPDLWELPSFVERRRVEDAALRAAQAAVDFDLEGHHAGRSVVAAVHAAMRQWTAQRWPEAPWMWSSEIEMSLPF